ncbi:MAG: hypothetical protein GF419_12675 [Ignavibacteriales bacterium]|jgi:hypothetical protein|nr:hypothetical protein [Ignavibacteriales bacterium]
MTDARTPTAADYIAPTLLPFLLFASNFLHPEIQELGAPFFAVWAGLGALCFVAGWFVAVSFDWPRSISVVSTIVAVVAVLSALFVWLFSEKFFGVFPTISIVVVETLRVTALGGFALFGAALFEAFDSRKTLAAVEETVRVYERNVTDARREAELTIREAKSRAKEIEAELKQTTAELERRKSRLEQDLRELVLSEIDFIKRHEKETHTNL